MAAFEADQSDAAVQLGRSSGRKVRRAILHQHAAMHRPGGFQLLHGADPTFLRRRPETPRQGSVVGPQAVHAAVGGTEQNRARMPGGRRVDPRPRGELPQPPAVASVQADDLMFVDQRGKDLAVGRDRRRNLAAGLDAPDDGRIVRHGGRNRSRAQRVGAKRRPVLGRQRAESQERRAGAIIRRSPFQTLFAFPLFSGSGN